MEEDQAALKGRVVVVTGCTHGIGASLVGKLAALGATLALVSRDAARGKATQEAVAAVPGVGAVDLFLADLSNNKDVHRLAAELTKKYSGGIHVLVNNAGTLTLRRQHNLDGVEETWAVNVLAPYALTELLLPALKAGGESSGQPSRVINVGSDAHKLARRLNLEDPCFDKKVNFVGFPGAYAHSKLALLSLTYELAFRLRSEACSTVTVNCIHPGAVNTNLGNSAVWWAGALKRTVGRLFLRTAASGSEGIAALCWEPRFASISGVYYVDQGKDGKHAVATLTAPHTSDQVICKRLQQLCARMTQARQPVVVSPPSSPMAKDKGPAAPSSGDGDAPAQPAPAPSVPAVPDAPPAPVPVPDVAPPPAAEATPPPPDGASELVMAQLEFANATQEAAQAATRISESLRAASEAELAADDDGPAAEAVQQAMARVDELRSPEEKAAMQTARDAEEAKAAAAAAKAQADAQAAAEAAAAAEKAEQEKAAQAEAERVAEEQRQREAAAEEARALEAAKAAAEALRMADEGAATAEEGGEEKKGAE
jgi:NAD(P)-dependent dehydrogenase (short-subunit alcohol dehydrogenase family)